MMRIRQAYIFTIAVLFMFPLFLNAQISVQKIDASFNPVSGDGIVYALPQTVVQLQVTIEQKELLAGPLRNYAEKYLGITNVINQNGFEYRLSDVKLSTLAVPDPEHYYYVNLEDKSSRTDWQTMISMNGAGMITALSPIGEVASGANGISNQLSQDEVLELFRHYADLNMYPKVDTIVRTISIDTMTIEDYSFRTTMTDKPLSVKAEETASMIHKIRESRYNLLTGYQEVNYSEGTIRFMNDELLKLERDYLRLFTGATVVKNLTYNFSFIPTPENAGSQVALFRLSSSTGIVEGGSGEPVSVLVDVSDNTAVLKASNGEGILAGGAGHGFFYRLPETADVKVLFRGNTLAQMQTPISQLGSVSALPVTAMDVEFDGKTGGLKSIKLDAE